MQSQRGLKSPPPPSEPTLRHESGTTRNHSVPKRSQKREQGGKAGRPGGATNPVELELHVIFTLRTVSSVEIKLLPEYEHF